MKAALVVQGGALRSVFTSGVLDAFLACNFNPFQSYIGVSGGAMCLSFYLSEQYKVTFQIMSQIAQDDRFINFKHLFRDEGYVNLSFLEQFTNEHYSLQVDKALAFLQERTFEVVTTNMENGEAEYLTPTAENWMRCLRASSTLPFLTRGYCRLDGMKLMDGGWSDPIPVQRMVQQGMDKVVVIRTLPKDHRLEWSFMGLLGGYYHRGNPGLAKRFSEDYEYYNATIDFLNDPAHADKIIQIAPEDFLKTGTYSTSPEKLYHDYRWGLEQGMDFIHQYGHLFT